MDLMFHILIGLTNNSEKFRHEILKFSVCLEKTHLTKPQSEKKQRRGYKKPAVVAIDKMSLTDYFCQGYGIIISHLMLIFYCSSSLARSN